MKVKTSCSLKYSLVTVPGLLIYSLTPPLKVKPSPLRLRMLIFC